MLSKDPSQTESKIESNLGSMAMIAKANNSSKLKKLNNTKDLLMEALSYLYFNDISLNTLLTKTPFPPKPLYLLGN